MLDEAGSVLVLEVEMKHTRAHDGLVGALRWVGAVVSREVSSTYSAGWLERLG